MIILKNEQWKPEQNSCHKNTSKKTKEVDRKYSQVPEHTVGPVQRKLLELGDVKGIVAGNFGEVSEDTHVIVIIVCY